MHEGKGGWWWGLCGWGANTRRARGLAIGRTSGRMLCKARASVRAGGKCKRVPKRPTEKPHAYLVDIYTHIHIYICLCIG